jgi:hypothetical protein
MGRTGDAAMLYRFDGRLPVIDAGTYVGQFFEHLGFVIVDEWYILSEFHGSEEFSTAGRMGNIKGLPSQQDLKRIADQARLLTSRS